MQDAEGTLVEIKGRVPFSIDISKLEIPEKPKLLSDDEIKEEIKKYPMKIVAATVGEDEHSVGLREVIDIKHGGIEKYGIECHYLGTSCPLEKLIDAAVELNADAILISTIITHNDVHLQNMSILNNLCIEKGIREKVILVGGGTQVSNEIAVYAGLDAGFGRGTKGCDVASFLIKRRRDMKAHES
jgi:D-ornithine 4,5-aminomutase subunit beta